MPTQGVCAVEIVLLRKHHSGPFFRSFSSRRPTMFLKRSKNCPRCAAFSRRIFLPRRPLGQRYGEFKNHLLVSSYLIAEDWPTWEMHPHGDETVCLLSGSVEFLLRTGDGESRVSLNIPGTFVIVPAGTWHTAKVCTLARMMFITPGEGTENRESPPV